VTYIILNKPSVSLIKSCFAYALWQFKSKVPSALGLNSNNWECFKSKLNLTP